MNQNEMIQSLRAEIAKLQRVLDLLLDQQSAPEEVRRPGRPKGSGNSATSFNPEEFAPKKRTLSAEGKARIAAAQKKRWAVQKRASAAGSTQAKSSASKRASNATHSKSAGKVAPKAAKKGTGAGKSAGASPAKAPGVSAKRTVTRATGKTVAKKTAAKRAPRSGVKTPAKQAVAAGPETTA